ncbi:lysophospholipid acyltransferase 7-like [Pollicipes pollicipes]|uniref:lysophospholipid acyltransferase 7-like n=1 Tax=Pollicipes pollicipes TaxID=41117 RepID=UPI0018855BEB|nr:lysophospholipid acyltransferase 7-like [Pollicipes pollicipes]
MQLVSHRYVHLVSFGFCFGYLAFVRLLDAFVHPVSPLLNLVQMLTSLRLVGLAFEVHNSWRLAREAKRPDLSDEARAEMTFTAVAPSAADQLYYTFFYVGIMTGPYYTFVTYRHCVAGTFWPFADCWRPALRRARLLPLYAALFLLLGHLWAIEYVSSDAMAARPVWYRVWYMYPVFAHFRMRMYIGFVLSELACMAHGLGAFPAASEARPGRGPTRHAALLRLMEDPAALAAARYDFETVHNIREDRVELDVTMTSVLKQWNTTVQYWLYTVVYRSVPGSKVVRASLTMLVSAFWHGIRSGYYLSLLVCPLYMAVEDVWDRLLRRRLSPQRVWLYDAVTWLLRVSMFSYLSMGFLLLGAEPTLAYWRSVFWCGHAGGAALYAVGLGLAWVFGPVRSQRGKVD